MKGLAARGLAALVVLVLLASGAAAQENMELYVTKDALGEHTARQMTALLNQALPDACWTLTMEAESGMLRERVLEDRAPALAICSPQEALPWAREGLLVPLQAGLDGVSRVQEQVLDCCVQEENLVLAPLYARHRQLAVNKKSFEDHGLGYMLDRMTYPVWYPAQFYQILEEFFIRDETAMDIWLPDEKTGAALEALVQAIFGGSLLDAQGVRCRADSEEILAGLSWLCDAVEQGLIGLCESREEALSRFLDGETAIFADWTQSVQENAPELVTMPYPTAYGMPVRSFEVTGAAAFESGNPQRDALAVKAAALLFADEQALLGSRAIWQDQAVWLPSLDAHEHGATLRHLLRGAMHEVIAEGTDAAAALARVQAAMDAYK